MKLENTNGQIFYGIHFYPGVAEYAESGKDPFRVFLNEATLRLMDPTFAGKPVFVEHVDEVDPSIDELRKEADGWVVESFFNQADGKHWTKFIVVSERGLKAIQSGMRLSNAYIPKGFRDGGLWNGVTYAKEIVNAEYEHLAIVRNPRYEESVILTPEEFKRYNEDKEIELKRLANSKDEKGEKDMGLSFFKKAKVENTIDLESTVVQLPKSKKEFTIVEIVNQLDAIHNMHGYANEDHMVKLGENEMSVKDLVKDYMAKCNEMEKMKSAKSEEGGEPGKGADDDMKNDEEEKSTVEEGMKDVDGRGGDKNMNDDADGDADDMKKKKNEIAKKAAAVKNAGPSFGSENFKSIELPADKVARGRALFGSN